MIKQDNQTVQTITEKQNSGMAQIKQIHQIVLQNTLSHLQIGCLISILCHLKGNCIFTAIFIYIIRLTFFTKKRLTTDSNELLYINVHASSNHKHVGLLPIFCKITSSAARHPKLAALQNIGFQYSVNTNAVLATMIRLQFDCSTTIIHHGLPVLGCCRYISRSA